MEIERSQRRKDRLDLFRSFDRVRTGGEGQTQKVLDLSDDDGHRDTRGKTDGDGRGYVLDERAEMENAHQDQDNARQERGDDKSRKTVRGDDSGYDGRERGGRAGDIHVTAAEKGDKKARDDGGVQSLFGRNARGDRERDGKRQRDDGDDNACDEIVDELGLVIRFQRAEKFGLERFHILSYGVRKKNSPPRKKSTSLLYYRRLNLANAKRRYRQKIVKKMKNIRTRKKRKRKRERGKSRSRVYSNRSACAAPRQKDEPAFSQVGAVS